MNLLYHKSIRRTKIWEWCFAISVFYYSCSGRKESKQDQPQPRPQTERPATIRKPPSNFQDTIEITGKSAVFYNPDSLQMKKIQAVNSRDVFSMLTHDCHFQQQYARETIRSHWPSIRIIECSHARWLWFKGIASKEYWIDLNEKNDICGMFIFDGNKKPVLVDMPNVDTYLNNYFNK